MVAQGKEILKIIISISTIKFGNSNYDFYDAYESLHFLSPHCSFSSDRNYVKRESHGKSEEKREYLLSLQQN
jgi:hypothetical protein